MDTTRELPASTVETIGLPKPAVVRADAERVPDVRTCTEPAMLPPAIAARVHFKKGSMPPTTEAVTTMPATTAAGVATVSKRLSTQGT